MTSHGRSATSTARQSDRFLGRLPYERYGLMPKDCGLAYRAAVVHSLESVPRFVCRPSVLRRDRLPQPDVVLHAVRQTQVQLPQ